MIRMNQSSVRVLGSIALAAFVSVSALGSAGCNGRSTQQPNHGAGQWNGGGPPNQGYPNQGYPNQGYPNQGYPQGTQPYPQGTQPYPQGTPPAAPVTNDPINGGDISWMRQRTAGVLAELVAALPAAQQQRVSGIPLIVDSAVGEVNAYAACDKGGRAAMAVTDGLLDVAGHLAQFKATDEIFGTKKTDAYIQVLATQQKPGKPVVQPPPGFIDGNQHVDGRKVARQNVLFDEELAFIMGHELGHHYLGHTGCVGGGIPGLADIGRLLSNTVPVFNQPNEVSADIAGTQNLLNAGRVRQGAKWSEGGAMLVLGFFAGIDRMSPQDIVFGFERSHPPTTFRVPIVQQAAQNWRSSGGQSVPMGF